MFVDIFPKTREIPAPINITPRAPQKLVCFFILSCFYLFHVKKLDIVNGCL